MNWVLGGPWQRREIVWPGARIVAGLIAILITWIGCSGTLDQSKQAWWLAIGSLALIVSLSGVAGFVKVGLRNLRYLERLMLGSARAQLAAAGAAIPADVRSAKEAEFLVTVPGSTLVHRHACLLVAGKSVHAVTANESARLESCGMCQP